MKRLLLVLAFALSFGQVIAQNIQLHYDLGEDRQMLTSTVEMFKADDFGNSFFFFDFEYGSKSSNVDGVSTAYFEITREFNFWEAPVNLHLEYNGGMFRTDSFSGQINSAFLVGASHTIANQDFSKYVTLIGMYKNIKNKNDVSFQLTSVWELKLFQNKITFMGFADFWREDNIVFDDNGNASNTDFVFLTEPQLWYHLTDRLSAGGEIEISSNFGGNKGLMINPTLGLKWIF